MTREIRRRRSHKQTGLRRYTSTSTHFTTTALTNDFYRLDTSWFSPFLLLPGIYLSRCLGLLLRKYVSAIITVFAVEWNALQILSGNNTRFRTANSLRKHVSPFLTLFVLSRLTRYTASISEAHSTRLRHRLPTYRKCRTRRHFRSSRVPAIR